jgi:hypothetical protein
MVGNITRDTSQVNGRIIEFYRDTLEDFIHVVVQVDTTHEQDFYNYAEVFDNDTIQLITLEGPLYWSLTFFENSNKFNYYYLDYHGSHIGSFSCSTTFQK